MKFEIIDTHVHVWDLANIEYGWLDGDKTILNKSYFLDEVLPDVKSEGVTGIVLVQAANNEKETDWLLSLAEDYSIVKGVVGWLPMIDPGAVHKKLKQYESNSLFKGVRHLIHIEPDPNWLMQETVLESLNILAAYNMTFDVVGINNLHLSNAIEIANRIPGLRLVLDHMNQPPYADNTKFEVWKTLMSEAVALKNIYIKISGTGMARLQNELILNSGIQPSIEFVLQRFGAERCFLGGDWPVSLLSGTYQQTLSAYKQVLRSLLIESDFKKVFYSTAVRFYRL